ncbi:MAG: hypothetical protein KIS91_09750 [Anaerolineae bacterium]|nr:hypothetical protein [Anaerolineae bacterium]
MAAAPADTPTAPADQKIKKTADNTADLTLQLTRTRDILRDVADGARRPLVAPLAPGGHRLRR